MWHFYCSSVAINIPVWQQYLCSCFSSIRLNLYFSSEGSRIPIGNRMHTASMADNRRGFLIQLCDEGDTPEQVTTIFAPITNLDPDVGPSQSDYYLLKSWVVTALRLVPYVDAIPLTFLSDTCSAASVGITVALEAWLKHRRRRDGIRGD